MKNCFETERLRFRPFEPTDLPRLAEISADPETSRYVDDGEPLSPAEVRRWIENSRRNVAEHGYGTGAVVLKERDLLIGWAGIGRRGDGSEEILYGLDRDWWGQGLGTELLAGLLDWIRRDLGLREVRATVDRRNAASIAMLERQAFALVEDCYGGDPDTCLFVLELS